MEAINASAYFLRPVLPYASIIMFFHCRYNKRDVDFSSLRDYNDYLEQVEDIGKSSDSACTKEWAFMRGMDQGNDATSWQETHHAIPVRLNTDRAPCVLPILQMYLITELPTQ